MREGGRKGLRAYPFTHRQQFLVVGGEGTRESEEEEGMGTGEGQEGVVADDGIADSGLEGGRVRPEGLLLEGAMPFFLGFANYRAAGRDDVMCPLGVGVVGGEKEGGRLQGHIAARNDIDSLDGLGALVQDSLERLHKGVDGGRATPRRRQAQAQVVIICEGTGREGQALVAEDEEVDAGCE